MCVHGGMFTYMPIGDLGVKFAIIVKENLIQHRQERLGSSSQGQAALGRLDLFLVCVHLLLSNYSGILVI